MKKWIRCLLLVCLMAVLTGCGLEDDRVYEIGYAEPGGVNYVYYLNNEYDLFERSFLEGLSSREEEDRMPYFYGDRVSLGIYKESEENPNPRTYLYMVGEYGYTQEDKDQQYGVLVVPGAVRKEPGLYQQEGDKKLYKITAEEYDQIKEKAYKLTVEYWRK